MSAPYKMKGFSGFGNEKKSPMEKASPAEGILDTVKKAGRAAYDKASQVGMGVIGGLNSDSDGTRGSGIIATAKRYYKSEKKADENMRSKQREKEALGYVIPERKKKSKK